MLIDRAAENQVRIASTVSSTNRDRLLRFRDRGPSLEETRRFLRSRVKRALCISSKAYRRYIVATRENVAEKCSRRRAERNTVGARYYYCESIASWFANLKGEERNETGA